ncbi:hypothetical protein D3C75_1283870 [compost metagenome]
MHSNADFDASGDSVPDLNDSFELLTLSLLARNALFLCVTLQLLRRTKLRYTEASGLAGETAMLG